MQSAACNCLKDCVGAPTGNRAGRAVNSGKMSPPLACAHTTHTHTHTHTHTLLLPSRDWETDWTEINSGNLPTDTLWLPLCLCLFVCFFGLSNFLKSLLKSLGPNLQSLVLHSQGAPHVWCELLGDTAASVLSQISRQLERERETRRGVVPVGDPLHSAPVLSWQDRH